MTIQTLIIAGRHYVLIPRDEYDRRRRSKTDAADVDLPELPPAGPDGTYPAVETGRAVLARKIIKRRWALGWPQTKLARTAGIRPEALNRIEKCRVTPHLTTVNKLVAALTRAEREAGEE